MGWLASAALLCALGAETTDAKPAGARVRFLGQAAIGKAAFAECTARYKSCVADTR
ncbi:hypothetical protein [Pseudoduganella sp. R-43]|uniref:hypothetical protein n=1 Tax=unclassified Pseudoduganella TaxID=2637179 RepID=UPI003CF2172D